MKPRTYTFGDADSVRPRVDAPGHHQRRFENDLESLDALGEIAQVPVDETFADRALISSLLAACTAREERVVRLVSGFGGGEPLLFADIGEALDISPARARQIHREALLKMRRRYKLRFGQQGPWIEPSRTEPEPPEPAPRAKPVRTGVFTAGRTSDPPSPGKTVAGISDLDGHHETVEARQRRLYAEWLAERTRPVARPEPRHTSRSGLGAQRQGTGSGPVEAQRR